jgi:lipoate-protein ligase A
MSPLVTQPLPKDPGRILNLSYPSPFRNLALEEALATSNETASRTTVRLWENPPTAILGRYQKPTHEIDIAFCETRGIEIARRFTGGGAVYHDHGNLNFTIATTRTRDCTITGLHNRYTAIILGMLRNFGVEGSFASPNTIEVSGKKISGAAAWVGNQNVLWHASILISTDTMALRGALSPSKVTKRTSFTRSKWREVITLEQAGNKPLDLHAVKRTLVDTCERQLGLELQDSQLTENETVSMTRLFEEKYSKDYWNLCGHWKKFG